MATIRLRQRSRDPVAAARLGSPMICSMCTIASAYRLQAVLAFVAFGLACSSSAPVQPPAESARAFLNDAAEKRLRLAVEAGRAAWVQSTFITDRHPDPAARANEPLMPPHRLRQEARRFDALQLPPRAAS